MTLLAEFHKKVILRKLIRVHERNTKIPLPYALIKHNKRYRPMSRMAFSSVVLAGNQSDAGCFAD